MAMTSECKRDRHRLWGARAAALAVALFGLQGCGGVKSALGLDKNPPDEFAVVTQAPLIVPPDFSLRPPKPGAPRPQVVQPTETARRVLLGEAAPEGDEDRGPSAAEIALLRKAGVDKADPNIRVVLNEEAGRLRQKKASFVDKVLFWREGDKEPPPAIIDPQEESQKLKSGRLTSADGTM